MTEKKAPPPPDTPRGGVHSRVDPDSLAERAIDKAHDAKQIAMHADDRSAEALHLSRRHAEMIERLPLIEQKLDLALRPIHRPQYVNIAVATIAICALVMATASVVRTQAILEAKATLAVPMK